ncbi:hypothetical protein [Dubosiella newyorkensis]|uniref:hypothetical protein n=2 Tax=Dubosiella newyorkensis TaxID=1862672 RepID=UPI00272DA568|nr:hypothetical protein [Dubosiella newyorkensis]
MAENLIANGNFWDGFNGYTKDGISYELKTYDRFFDYCEFKGNSQRWSRFYTYFKDGTKFVAGKTYRIGFWGRSDNSNSIYIGCNDGPLTFSLTPQWKWYESEYVSTLDQAISIINPDTTNTVCISGIWIQLGNDLIVPEVSPYIETIEMHTHRINLDSSQIEQGSSVGGVFGVTYSNLKNPGSNNLFSVQLRSRNIYEIPTANREVEIIGDFTGFKVYITEYDSDKKSIANSGWLNNPKFKVRNDTRYISLLIANSSHSTITPSQFISRGGVLIMSDYPTLPIVKDDSGFEYAEGMNLLINTGGYIENSPFATTSNKTDNWVVVFNGKFIYSPVPCGKGQKITLQAKSNLPWSDRHPGAGPSGKAGFWLYWGNKADVMNGRYIYAQFIAGDNTTVFQKTIKAPDLSILANLTKLYFCFRFNTYSDGTNDVTGKFWDLMVEYGDKKHPYRPNPADLVGGGNLWQS